MAVCLCLIKVKNKCPLMIPHTGRTDSVASNACPVGRILESSAFLGCENIPNFLAQAKEAEQPTELNVGKQKNRTVCYYKSKLDIVLEDDLKN